MGIIRDLIKMKHDETQKATENALSSLQMVYSNEKATPENRKWAADGIKELLNTQFGGGSKGSGGGGKGGGKGGSIGDVFHGILTHLADMNPTTPNRPTRDALKDIKSSEPSGSLEMTDEQQQAQAQKKALQAQQIKAAIAEADRKVQAKAYDDAYNDRFKQLTASGVTPLQAHTQATEEAALNVYGKTIPKTDLTDPATKTKAPSAGKQVTIVGPDGKEFSGIERNDETGAPQLFKIGSATPLDPNQYASKVKEPLEPGGLRALTEAHEILDDKTGKYSQAKKEAAQDLIRDEKNKQTKQQVEIRVANDQATPAAPGAMETVAQQYVDSGGTITPPLQFRGRQRTDFFNAVAAEIKKRRDGGEDTSLIETRVKQAASKSAMTELSKIGALLNSQEKGTFAEIDRAKILASKLRPDQKTKIKSFNKLDQFVSANLIDDPDLARFREALVSVRQRYSSMVSNLRGGGAATNMVRVETADEIIDRAMASGALDAALDEMKVGIKNITTGVDDAKKEAEKEFKGTIGSKSKSKSDIDDIDDPLHILH